MSIEAQLRLAYPEFILDVDLDLPGRGVTALYGPSGSGKTTLLRCIAGLERAPGGRLIVNGETWQDDAIFLPTHKRPLGYVFQEASLFPHLTVLANLQYGLKRVPAAERRVSLDQAIELLGIGHLLDRRPDRLSGGERQRVAIARALAPSPRLLLMDEPLAALDIKLKREILPYLDRLHDALEIPVLYVSHSPDEVSRLADYLVLMAAGRATACGSVTDLTTRLDLPLAHGDTAAAVVEAAVAGHDTTYELTFLEFSGGRFTLPRHAVEVGQRVRIRIQARDVSLTLEPQTGTSILNILPATVTGLADDSPGQVMVGLDVGGTPLLSRITRKSVDALGLAPGRPIYAQVKGVAILD